MNNEEIRKLCLEDRTGKIKELKKKLEQLDIDYAKISLEERMYANLKNSSSLQYRQSFGEKHSEYEKKLNELELYEEELKKDINILQREIDYLERVK